jgi:tRNA threonylcarbamoyladenosine biosynthesis protein TsaE
MTNASASFRLRSPEDTRGLGRELGRRLLPGDLVFLHGTLGAGKTVLARGVLESLGVDDFRGSPTFSLIYEYESDPRAIHVDLYRLQEADVEGLGLEEYAADSAIMLVEWPERARSYLANLARGRIVTAAFGIAGPVERLVRVQGIPLSNLVESYGPEAQS